MSTTPTTVKTPAASGGGSAESEYARESQKGYLALLVVVGTILCFGTMIFLQSGPPDVTLSATALRLRSGAYGVTVPLADVEAVTLQQRLSGIGRKQNAYQFGSTYAGRFEVRPHGSTLLFLDATRPPFVQLVWRGMVLIFNARNASETRFMFDSLARVAARRSTR